MTRRIALVGNPNVGKSTIFNSLTGMRQHTGNWAGVTVSCTYGAFEFDGVEFSVVDLPGIYSFDTRSEEEAVTRQFVEAGAYDVLLLVCDATCLERGLHLLRQAVQIYTSGAWDVDSAIVQPVPVCPASAQSNPVYPALPELVLCVNLCDEAAKKGIVIDFPSLEQALGIPVIPCRAREKHGLDTLKSYLSTAGTGSLGSYLQSNPESEILLSEFAPIPYPLLSLDPEMVTAQTVEYTDINHRSREERMDRVLTNPVSGSLCMFLLLLGVFWLTISGANVPSAMLWDLFFEFETILADTAVRFGAPQWFISAFIYGVYRVVAWIVSVMLPPMAIFFPLFTLLEDFGYLPRIAYNMDGVFQKCSACGKQCLTMAMGLGCNAAGVTGCRIIDSPRERLIAILTNSLVPCNGRFPLLITMISLCLMGISRDGSTSVTGCKTDFRSGFASDFEAGSAFELEALLEVAPWLHSFISAFLLTGFILLSFAATLGTSWVLSHTLLKGVPSSFTLELPPYRRPQVKKVIVRSVFDRTLFVLGRAVIVAAPAGLLIWMMANIKIPDGMLPSMFWDSSAAGIGNTLSEAPTLLSICSGLLDPLGQLMGLDGVILMAFILGFPANEIVLPIILMAYMQNGYLVEMEETSSLFALLSAQGWTLKTYVCMAIFSLFHWPCSTTCLTIRKETGSLKWTAVAVLLPTLLGVGLCMAVSWLL